MLATPALIALAGIVTAMPDLKEQQKILASSALVCLIMTKGFMSDRSRIRPVGTFCALADCAGKSTLQCAGLRCGQIFTNAS